MRFQSLLILIVFLALAACGDVRDDLGLGRSSPDEFAVVDRPPLSMPPDYTLRPPKPGEPRPQEVDLTQRASDTLFGGDSSAVQKTADESGAEKTLLDTAGADKANPDIRTIIDREASEKVVGDQHLVEDLLWWKNKGPDSTIVDAPAEAARIKAAQTAGQPINQSGTPVIERQKTGWLGL